MSVQIQSLEALWTFKETMNYLRVSRSTLLRWMIAGVITGHKVGSTWRFYPSDVKALIDGPKTAEQGGES